MKRVAYFISEHGFGHASRASAIIEKLLATGMFQFYIFSQVPKWFFENSYPGILNYQPVRADIGLIQIDPFHEDLCKTLDHLEKFYPIKEQELKILAKQLIANNIEMVICDISPLGLLAAQFAGIPSVLVENFTWDWIYEPYIKSDSRFTFYCDYLGDLISSATFHFQAAPVCLRDSLLSMTKPIFREPRTPRSTIRAQLGVPVDANLVLIALGGIPINADMFINKNSQSNRFYVIPAQDVDTPRSNGNMLLLPHNHRFFHPDLMHASDLVVGKAGYSTIAEVYSAGIPFIYIGRENFREAPILESYIDQNLNGKKITLAEFLEGDWLEITAGMNEDYPVKRLRPNGADQVSSFVSQYFDILSGDSG